MARSLHNSVLYKTVADQVKACILDFRLVTFTTVELKGHVLGASISLQSIHEYIKRGITKNVFRKLPEKRRSRGLGKDGAFEVRSRNTSQYEVIDFNTDNWPKSVNKSTVNKVITGVVPNLRRYYHTNGKVTIGLKRGDTVIGGQSFRVTTLEERDALIAIINESYDYNTGTPVAAINALLEYEELRPDFYMVKGEGLPPEFTLQP